MMKLSVEPGLPKNPGARSVEVFPELLAEYPALLTVEHLRELTGLSKQTLRTLINSGELPGCRIGRRLYVPKNQFIDFVEKGI